MSIPGLLRIPIESSDPNDKIKLFNFKGEVFTVPGAHRKGNCPGLSDFEKLSRIGEGNFGIVYKVRHKSSNKIFALKRLKTDQTTIFEESGYMPQNFLREITNLKHLKHHNIVKLVNVAVGEHFERTYLVLEFCEYSLDGVIDDNPSCFQRSQVKNIMYQLFNGLSYMHKHCIFHRDVNPSNILFNEEGILKITDFGSSRKLFTGNLTPNVGTQWYRAPEILFGSENYSLSIDIWSAGCVFAELLLQRVLFHGDSDCAIINLIINLLGSPVEKEWPEHLMLPLFQIYELRQQKFNKFRTTFITESSSSISLIHEMLVYNPSMRLSAEKCLEHPYFSELPEACSFEDLVCTLKASKAI